MRKKIFFVLIILLSLLTNSAFATTGGKVSISEVITAYKYSTSDIFTSTDTDKVMLFELIDRENISIAELSKIDISEALDQEIRAFRYKISGNIKENISIQFTFNQLTVTVGEGEVQVEPLSYYVRVVPETATITNMDFSNNKIVTATHQQGTTTYIFVYNDNATSSTSNQTPLITGSTPVSINYETVYNVTNEAGEMTPEHAVIDHWVRQGSVFIKVPLSIDDTPNPIQSETYTSALTITITTGA